MADIRVEEKKSGSVLPWILGLVGLVLLGWLAVDVFDKDGEPELFTEDEVNFPDGDFQDGENSDLINAMDQKDGRVDFNGNEQSALIVSDDNLHKLVGQLDEMVDEVDMENNAVIQAEMRKLRNAETMVYANDTDDDRMALKQAAMAATNILETVQRAKYPEMSNNVAAIRAAVDRDDLDEEDFLKFYETSNRVMYEIDNADDIYGTDAS